MEPFLVFSIPLFLAIDVLGILRLSVALTAGITVVMMRSGVSAMFNDLMISIVARTV